MKPTTHSLRAAADSLKQMFPGRPLFLIVVQEDGTISTTSNLCGAHRIDLLASVIERQIERATEELEHGQENN